MRFSLKVNTQNVAVFEKLDLDRSGLPIPHPLACRPLPTPVSTLLHVFSTKKKMHEQSVVIVGEVGSGKSTVIAGILGELPVYSPSPKHLDGDMGMGMVVGLELRGEGTVETPGARKGKGGGLLCYAAQNPWVMSGTVRENVLFGLPMKEDCYRCVTRMYVMHVVA